MECNNVKKFVDTLKKIKCDKLTEIKSAYEFISHEVDQVTELDAFSTYIGECNPEELDSVEIGLVHLYEHYKLQTEGKQIKSVMPDNEIANFDKVFDNLEGSNVPSIDSIKKGFIELMKEIAYRENLKIRLNNLAVMISIVEIKQKEISLETHFADIVEKEIQEKLSFHESSHHDRRQYTLWELVKYFSSLVKLNRFERILIFSAVWIVFVKIGLTLTADMTIENVFVVNYIIPLATTATLSIFFHIAKKNN
ncbi:hypothetical protein RZE82_07140 [Mollicutes bacterium LVI A0039]|nr:hypothetical protein RZE82_07140 [Mollicutes bacterium LVI A0039]